MRGYRVTGCGAGLVALVVLGAASASPTATGACEMKPCKYDVLAAVDIRSPDVSAKYSAVFRNAFVSVGREPDLAARPKGVSAAMFSVNGPFKSRVHFHPQGSDCPGWRKDYNVAARLSMQGWNDFTRPIENRVKPPIWGRLGLDFAPLRELRPGKPCPEYSGGIGWVTEVAEIFRQDGRNSFSARFGGGANTSTGVESLGTEVLWNHHGKHALAKLGFPLDRLWLGKGFKAAYALRGVPDTTATVRLEFVRRR